MVIVTGDGQIDGRRIELLFLRARLFKKLADKPGTYVYVVTTEDLAFTAQLEKVGLIVPFLYYDKVEAVRRGVASGMKIENTWSCYKGGDIHCGRCGTCVERLWAIHEAGADDIDRTEYADTEYWKTVTESDNNSNEEN